MTRINIIPVEALTGQHLVAEYRELPRVFALAHKASLSSKPFANRQPKEYTLGTGHVLFFYDKLLFLANRHKQLVNEMLARGYKPTLQDCLMQQWQGVMPIGYWQDYEPTNEAIKINIERINKRLSGDKTQ